MSAIIYTTNTGSTEHYAKLLAQKTGLPVYSLAEAKKRVFAGAEVIYLGWIMAGSVKGYAEAAKRYQVRAVCGVGMGQTGTQTDNTRKKSAISADIPLFTLQGNFDVKKLHGVYRLMMEIMVKTAGKALAEKKDRTPDEDDMLDTVPHPRRCASRGPAPPPWWPGISAFRLQAAPRCICRGWLCRLQTGMTYQRRP